MTFDIHYDDWNHKRATAIIGHYKHTFFAGKTVLDLGAGHGDLAAALVRLGADVLCVDAREQNLAEIRRKHPSIKTARVDLDNEWPFSPYQFDVVLSLGLLCHLKNYEQHIKNICGVAEHVILETETLDSSEPNLKTPVYEERSVADLSYHGEGSIVSARTIQNRLSEIGATFKRFDDSKLNSGIYKYDWKEANSGRCVGNRRFWFIRADKHIVKMQEHQINVQRAENGLVIDHPQLEGPPKTMSRLDKIRYNSSMFKDRQQSRFTPPRPQNTMPIPYIRPQPKPYIAPTKSKIRLFYNYYEDKDLQRKKEIDYCLDQNINNTNFDLIVLGSDKIPTYGFFFEKINQLAGPDDISIICNSDIFFDDSIRLIDAMGAKDFYALSRWDWSNGSSTLRDLKNSQDTWIIRGKIENVNGDIPLGVPFCDNRIAFEFSKAGYRVLNPAKSIKTYHYHQSGVRRYNDNERVPGPILFIETSTL